MEKRKRIANYNFLNNVYIVQYILLNALKTHLYQELNKTNLTENLAKYFLLQTETGFRTPSGDFLMMLACI